ncbi:MAG: hypothetical protein R3F61_22765 [Myxococcota bacterium]
MIALLALAAAAPSDLEETPMTTGPKAEITATREPGAVVLQWSVANPGSAPVWLADRLLVHTKKGAEAASERAVVRQPPAEGAPLRITVGYTAPYGMPFQELYPAVREVAPGSKATGTVRVPLPLASYHPMETNPAALAEPTRAVVAIGWFASAPETRELKLADRSTVSVLTAASARESQWLEVPVDWP